MEKVNGFYILLRIRLVDLVDFGSEGTRPEAFPRSSMGGCGSVVGKDKGATRTFSLSSGRGTEMA